MLGSPPHTWRIQTYTFSLEFQNGITSTYVENTLRHVFVEISIWDHLHIRGEYILVEYSFPPILGSPPHTWRILFTFMFMPSLLRITSTYVENTEIISMLNVTGEDHLHIRGEYPLVSVPSACLLGSPPHTWRILTN